MEDQTETQREKIEREFQHHKTAALRAGKMADKLDAKLNKPDQPMEYGYLLMGVPINKDGELDVRYGFVHSNLSEKSGRRLMTQMTRAINTQAKEESRILVPRGAKTVH